MRMSPKFSTEVSEHAVRMVQERSGNYPSLWVFIESISAKIGCMAQSLHEKVKKSEVDSGVREGATRTALQCTRRPFFLGCHAPRSRA
jgi:transposase